MPEFSEDFDIRRKDDISEDDRTPDKDAAAEVIERMWPDTRTAIADEAGYTRQHISNTLNDYFEPIEWGARRTRGEADQNDVNDNTRLVNGQQITIEIPEGVDPTSYLEGYLDALSETWRIKRK